MLYTLDTLLNRLTMYRLILYYLILLILAAVLLGFFSLLPYSPVNLISNTLFLVVICYISNKVYAKAFNAVTNIESVFVTALILAFLITPSPLLSNLGFLTAAGVFASGSKYLLAIKRKHIFNPVAISVVLTGILFNQFASWWVGIFPLTVLTLLGGVLVLRRVQRFSLVGTFLIAYFLISGIFNFSSGHNFTNLIQVWNLTILHTSLLFFAIVMVTEPLTSPVSKRWMGIYAGLVAILYAMPQIPFLNLSLTSEQALVIGNIFSYLVNPKFRLVLKLKEKSKLTPSIYKFIFARPREFKFKAGQFLEWTLAHEEADSRGNRRTFSLSSSPSEDLIMVIVKILDGASSSFKRALKDLPEGREIIASNLGGDFVLPQELDKKLVFIAGGVGIAPFRSMIKYTVDLKEKRSVTLIYSNNLEEEILFKDTFAKAEKFGVKIIYTLTDKQNLPKGWKGEKGRIDKTMVKKYVPDFKERIFYLSGPQLMVETFQKILGECGVPKGNIKLDYFPGYSDT